MTRHWQEEVSCLFNGFHGGHVVISPHSMHGVSLHLFQNVPSLIDSFAHLASDAELAVHSRITATGEQDFADACDTSELHSACEFAGKHWPNPSSGGQLHVQEPLAVCCPPVCNGSGKVGGGQGGGGAGVCGMLDGVLLCPDSNAAAKDRQIVSAVNASL